jgi:glutamate 5-kinase
MKTIVVKFGSSTVTGPRGRLRRGVLTARAAEIADLLAAGHHVVVVSSGAIACGQALLGMGERPREMPALQAASAVGQGRLFAAWSRALASHGRIAAQVLLTSADVADRAAYVNARHTLRRLLSWGAVPVVNENDTTATDEIRFGDNDILAAQVAIMLGADLLLLLTDRGGLYTSDPRHDRDARLIEELNAGSAPPEARLHAQGGGAGGMRGKVAAALMTAAADVPAVIADGAAPRVIARAIAGEPVGTRVRARSGGESAFKLWLRYAKPARGTLDIDEGAARALREAGASLLPVGVLDVHGTFSAGDAVVLRAPSGREVARGVAAMSAREVRRVVGLRSAAVRLLLPHAADEVVHRDRLVLIDEEDV